MSISKTEFARRRKNLMALMDPHSIAIIPSAREQVRSRDTEYPFRQDSDFYYLSGFTEPEAVLVLLPGRRHGQFVVFCRERDPKMEMWTGHRAGPEAGRSNPADGWPVGVCCRRFVAIDRKTDRSQYAPRTAGNVVTPTTAVDLAGHFASQYNALCVEQIAPGVLETGLPRARRAGTGRSSPEDPRWFYASQRTSTFRAPSLPTNALSSDPCQLRLLSCRA